MLNSDAWDADALCSGMDTELFFDKYENNKEIAEDIDELCLGCPIISECFKRASGYDSWGVWGGVYFSDGEIDKEKNSHKTKEIWFKIYDRVNDES